MSHEELGDLAPETQEGLYYDPDTGRALPWNPAAIRRDPRPYRMGIAPIGPQAFGIVPERDGPTVSEDAEAFIRRLVTVLRGVPLTAKAPDFLCPPFFGFSVRAASATQNVAPGATNLYANFFTAASRERFRFLGLIQRVSDPVSAADSVWRVLVNRVAKETITGIVSGSTVPAPIFVHGRSGDEVALSVQNIGGPALAFDASAVLVGYRVGVISDMQGPLGAIQD